MKIKVLGKAHLKGISKRNGNPYNFIQVHYNGRAFGVEGVAALTLSLDPKDYPYDDVAIGGEYNVEFDMANVLLSSKAVGSTVKLNVKAIPHKNKRSKKREDVIK